MVKILIADDSATMRRMVRVSLGGLADVSFEEASTGLEVVEGLALATIDLIVLDLNMPDMHGLEVLELIRTHKAYRSIPVVVLTTRGDEASRARALSAGASLYLTKPFDPREFAVQTRQLLEAHHGG